MERAVRRAYGNLGTALLQVDGGLGPSTVDVAAAAGANMIVAGSSVFSSPDPAAVMALLRESVEKHQGRKRPKHEDAKEEAQPSSVDPAPTT
jgi:ribulose-phosphate 3-epimerase